MVDVTPAFSFERQRYLKLSINKQQSFPHNVKPTCRKIIREI
jgi:hypothetical protein